MLLVGEILIEEDHLVHFGFRCKFSSVDCVADVGNELGGLEQQIRINPEEVKYELLLIARLKQLVYLSLQTAIFNHPVLRVVHGQVNVMINLFNAFARGKLVDEFFSQSRGRDLE